MLYYALKIIITSALIVLISEISKRSSLMGAILASIPLVSLLAILWLYFETKDIDKIRHLSTDIFWLVLPSLAFFIVLPVLLKKQMLFGWAMLIAAGVTILLYGAMLYVMKLVHTT